MQWWSENKCWLSRNHSKVVHEEQSVQLSVFKAFNICFVVGVVEGEDDDSFHSRMVVLIDPNQVSANEARSARVASSAARADKLLSVSKHSDCLHWVASTLARIGHHPSSSPDNPVSQLRPDKQPARHRRHHEGDRSHYRRRSSSSPFGRAILTPRPGLQVVCDAYRHFRMVSFDKIPCPNRLQS